MSKTSQVEMYLPMARTSDDVAEAKQTFGQFKRATDIMADKGMLMVDKVVSQCMMAEANGIRERIDRNRAIVNKFRDIYKDVLTFTETCNLGQW